MSFLNNVLRGLFDLLLVPFQSMTPWVTLLPISVIFAIVVLLVYKRVSNQAGIDAVKERIAASFFEIRLFNDDLRAILRAQADLLKNNGLYLGLNLVPLLWMLIPTVLVIAQLQFHYGYRGLEVDESVVVSVHLDPEQMNGAGPPDARLDVPDGLLVETPALWIPAKVVGEGDPPEAELAWRISPQQQGRYELRFNVDGNEFTKSVVVSDDVVRRSPARYRPAFFDQLLYPAEPPLDPDLGVLSITLPYPAATVGLFGIELQWLIWFLVLSIVFAFLLRKRFGVTF